MITAIIWVIGVVFGAGVSWAVLQAKVNKAQVDVNRVAQIGRDNERRAERRWKHQIATAIETSGTLDEAKVHAKLLREDAWRD